MGFRTEMVERNPLYGATSSNLLSVSLATVVYFTNYYENQTKRWSVKKYYILPHKFVSLSDDVLRRIIEVSIYKLILIVFLKFSAQKLQFSVSQKGRPIIQYGLNRYHRHSSYVSGNPKCRWVCVKTHHGCRGSIHTYNNVLFKVNNNHNHFW